MNSVNRLLYKLAMTVLFDVLQATKQSSAMKVTCLPVYLFISSNQSGEIPLTKMVDGVLFTLFVDVIINWYDPLVRTLNYQLSVVLALIPGKYRFEPKGLFQTVSPITEVLSAWLSMRNVCQMIWLPILISLVCFISL